MKSCMVWGSVAVLMGSLMASPAASQRQVSSDTRAEGPVIRTEEALNRLVTVDLDRTPVSHAIDVVARSAGVRIQYRADILDTMPGVITLHATQRPLRLVLEQVLAGTPLYAQSIAADLVTVKVMPQSVQQDGIITGTVIHATTKQPIAGATITVGTGTAGVTSAQDGTFRIAAATGEHKLHIRAIGMIRQTKSVVVPENGAVTVEFVLEPSASVLDEVVVTGTVVATERKAIPNPITVITAEEIEKRGITRIEEFFRGEVPGVLARDEGAMTYADYYLGSAASSNMYVRGASGFGTTQGQPGRTNPLKTYIDGVEVLDPAMLGLIDVQSIERIEIVTGPQAATIYGSGAMGGVMQIFTKQGVGANRTDATVRLQYGILQNNISDGLTPSHHDALSIQGGIGAALTYTANLSYLYRGQWQPSLYNRSTGTSFGLRTERGQVSIDASASFTLAQNGTSSTSFGHRVLVIERGLSGDWERYQAAMGTSRRVGRSMGNTLALNIDYRPGMLWYHHFTLGRNQNELAFDPLSPNYERPLDSLYKHTSSVGARVTANYSVTFLPQRYGILSSHLTLGTNGSSGSRMQVQGNTPDLTSPSYISPSVSRPLRDKSWGGFGRWQLGVFEQLYVTLGLRAEHNATYGRNHKIDWTPTNGVTYTIAVGEVTAKFLGSYGKATRAPDEQYRLARTATTLLYNELDTYTDQLEAPELTPEYSRGPQGGMELYFGNRGSLTINRYVQKVTDLIQSQIIDTINVTLKSNGDPRVIYVRQWQNVATIKNHGWESTGSLNVGVLSFRGTYSWTDSRVVASRISSFPPGFMFLNVPTHTAHMSMSYARGGTSVSLNTNYIGAHNYHGGDYPVRVEDYYARLQAYVNNARWIGLTSMESKGYVKSNLAIQHRVNPWTTAIVNVTNLGNHYGSEGALFDPTLGRQTMLGVSMRFPRR